MVSPWGYWGYAARTCTRLVSDADWRDNGEFESNRCTCLLENFSTLAWDSLEELWYVWWFSLLLLSSRSEFIRERRKNLQQQVAEEQLERSCKLYNTGIPTSLLARISKAINHLPKYQDYFNLQLNTPVSTNSKAVWRCNDRKERGGRGKGSRFHPAVAGGLISEASRQTWAVDTVIAEVRPEDYAHLYEKDS